MSVHLHVVPTSGHLALRVDEVRRANDAHERPSVHRLLLPDPVLLGGGVILVGEQRKGEVVLLSEGSLARLVQDADAEDRRLAGLKLWQVVAEGAGLFGATGSVVLRIEIQYEWTPGVVGEAVGLAVLIVETESGRLPAGFDERHELGPP